MLTPYAVVVTWLPLVLPLLAILLPSLWGMSTAGSWTQYESLGGWRVIGHAETWRERERERERKKARKTERKREEES